MVKRDKYPGDVGEWIIVDPEDTSPRRDVEHYPLRGNGRPVKNPDYALTGLPSTKAALRAVHRLKYEAAGVDAMWTVRPESL